MPVFTRKPNAQQLLEQAMNKATTRAASSTNRLVSAWVCVASLNSAEFAASLLQRDKCRVLSETMTERGAARVLSVIAATTLQFFMRGADTLAAVQAFGYQPSEDFERDVLDCFDSYGSTFLTVTRARAIESGNEASWSFGFYQHIFIAVQAPEENRAFSDDGEAILAGHTPSLFVGDFYEDFAFLLTVWGAFAKGYSNQFIPQLSATLAAGAPKPQV